MRRRWLALLMFVLACGWFIFAFRRYLPGAEWPAIKSVLSGFSLRDSVLLALAPSTWLSSLLDIALVLWFWLTSWVIGAVVVARIGLPRLRRSERFLFASALGISFWSFAALVLAASRLFYAQVLYGLMILVTLLGARRISRAVVGWCRHAAGTAGYQALRDRLLLVALGVFILLVLSVFFISALAPEIEFDARLTHLTAAKIYAQTHRLEPIPDIPQTFFPRSVTMLFAIGMVMKGETAAKLIQFLLGVLCLLTGYAIAARICRPACGWVAAVILASSPLLLWETRTAHLELGLTLYVSLALFTTMLWLTGQGHRFWWLGAYFLAFAQGTKYHALWALVTLPIIVLLFRIAKARKMTAVADTARFSLFSAAGLLPWAVVNLIQTGNPLFPFLNDVFRSPYWNSALSDYGTHEMSVAGLSTGADWLKLPAFLWYLVTDDTGRFRGNIGPFYLLFLPLLLLQRRWSSETKIILLFSGLYSLIWLFTAQHARYFLPLLPGLAAVSAVGLVYWLSRLEGTHRLLSALAVVLLFALAVLNSPLFERLGANARYGSVSVTDKLAWAYLAGRETKDQYLSRWISNHDAVLHFNRLPQPKKVLFWWTAPNFLGVENGGFACYYSPCFPELQSNDPAHVRHVLAENDITHFIVDQGGQDQALATRPDGPFAQAYLKPIFQKNGVILYEIEDQPGGHDPVTCDFLSHLAEAQFRLPSVSPEAEKVSFKRFVDIGGDRRWALAIPEGDAIFPVHVPERAVLRCSIAADATECSDISAVEIDVQWERTETPVFTGTVNGTRWQEVMADLSAFAGKDVKVIFRVKPTRFSGCGVYYWADPILVSDRNHH